MSLRIAAGDDAAILTSVLGARAQGEPCAVPPPHLVGSIAQDPLLRDVVGPRLVAFSSGSTGTARGIVRTHESWTASHAALTDLIGLTADDVVHPMGSLTSTLFLYGAVHAAEEGAQVALGREVRASAPITVAHCVPAQASVLLDAPPDSLRVVVVAGDRVPARLHERARERGVHLVDYYGAAELSFVAVRTEASAYAPFPGVLADVRDGEVWVRSPYVAEGYLDPQARGPLRCDGEWCTVGDRARRESGGLSVEGRGDSAVTVGAHTVILEDVEEHLRTALSTQDLAVLPEPHVSLGSVVVAVLTADPTPAERSAAVAGLPRPARPVRWLTVPALPRTAGGKVDRARLRDALEGR